MQAYSIIQGEFQPIGDGKKTEIKVATWTEGLPCPDCGGQLEEGSYVPGHMICASCGSHWESEGYEELPSGAFVFEVRRAVFYSVAS